MGSIRIFEINSQIFWSYQETCDWYQTMAIFLLYQVLKFQVSRIITFSAFNDEISIFKE